MLVRKNPRLVQYEIMIEFSPSIYYVVWNLSVDLIKQILFVISTLVDSEQVFPEVGEARSCLNTDTTSEVTIWQDPA